MLHPTFKGLYSTPDGGTFVYSFPAPTRATEPLPLQFKGPAYLLIGGQTYSSAAMFTQTFKHYKVGTVVGQEGGEPTVFYGDNYVFFLPATQLRVSVSHKRFVLPGGREDGHGTIPDHEVIQSPADDAVGRDAVLAYTLKSIP
jgi:C-terminal processing protease CtpA/Prc